MHCTLSFPVVDRMGWVGATLEGKYRIDALVGEGGFGCVYRAVHLRLGTPVAVKFLRPELALGSGDAAKFLRRFEREARTLQNLSRATTGVVQAHDFGVATSPRGEETAYLVMEWLEGHTLSDELAARPRRSLTDALELLSPVLDALAVAHDMGIAHRDLKPANLMVCRVGGRPTVKVLDFGIAQVLGPEHEATWIGVGGNNTRVFSLAHGAPEQFDPGLGPTGPWTDVYAVGLLILQLVDGEHPYAGDTYAELRAQALDLERRPALRSDRSIDDVMRRVLAVDWRNRPRTAGELRVELTRGEGEDDLGPPTSRMPSAPVAPTPAAPVPPALLVPARTSSSHPLWTIVAVGAGIVFLLLAVGGAMAARLLLQGGRTTSSARDAAPTRETQARDVLKQWNDAEDRHDIPELESMYADRVHFYHADLTPQQCGDKLRGLYRAYPGFIQQVHWDTVTVESLESSAGARVSFDKTYPTKTGVSTVRGYLVLDGEMRIVEESDARTDSGARSDGLEGPPSVEAGATQAAMR